MLRTLLSFVITKETVVFILSVILAHNDDSFLSKLCVLIIFIRSTHSMPGVIIRGTLTINQVGFVNFVSNHACSEGGCQIDEESELG